MGQLAHNKAATWLIQKYNDEYRGYYAEYRKVFSGRYESGKAASKALAKLKLKYGTEYRKLAQQAIAEGYPSNAGKKVHDK